MATQIKSIIKETNLQDGWEFHGSPDTASYETIRNYSKDLDKQLEEENNIFFTKVLTGLGLKEDKDYDGKHILRSIKHEERKLSGDNVKDLVSRLGSRKHKTPNLTPSPSTLPTKKSLLLNNPPPKKRIS